MVDVITPTKTVFKDGRMPVIEVSYAGFDGSGEYGVFDVWSEDIDFLPAHATMIVARSSGTTTTIDFDLDISWDGTTYIATDINNITAYDTHEHHPAAGASNDKGLMRPRYWKVTAVDEGSGNTNTATVWLYGK